MLKWFADRLAETGKDARKDERGFTLIELLVVVIIIGILAAIAIPTFLGQRDNARDATAQSAARNVLSAAGAYYTDSESYSGIEDEDYEALENIEPSYEYAGSPVAEDPETAGVSVNSDGDQITIGVGSASGDSFWVRRDESGTVYGTTEDGTGTPSEWGDEW